MSETYTDYVNRIAITIPDKYIDIKTGESHKVAPKIQEQIEYHTNNSTLSHLVFTALTHYFATKTSTGSNAEVLNELAEIKKMISQGYIPLSPSKKPRNPISKKKQKEVDIHEVDEVLDAFGG